MTDRLTDRQRETEREENISLPNDINIFNTFLITFPANPVKSYFV